MSFALRIELLTGRSVAAAYHDRQAHEWPPHPARVFSALVATHMEAESPSEAELSALQWLESLPPPAIFASEASARDAMTHFVPVNDTDALGGLDRALARLHEARVNLDAAARADAESPGQRRAARDVEKAKAELDRAMAAMRATLASAPKVSEVELRSAAALLPEGRTRQARHFPSCSPEDPRVYLIFEAEPGPHAAALDGLARRVVRIGHSATLVCCAIVDESPPPSWIPDEDGAAILRVVGPGQLAALAAEHSRHQQVEPRVLPCRFQRYRRADQAPPPPAQASVFGEDWIVLHCSKASRLPGLRAVALARAVRAAIQHFAGDDAPEWLSGHRGRLASPDPHLAIVPLPRAGHRYADGLVYGVALVIPRGLPEAARAPLYRALGAWRARQDEDGGMPLSCEGALLRVRVVEDEPTLSTLSPASWCGPSRAWISVTPVALDRNPGRLDSRVDDAAQRALERAAEGLALACGQVGLPRPLAVEWIPGAPMLGSRPARDYPRFTTHPGQPEKAKAHFVLRFGEAVRGPVLLGAGRFFGLGLFRPLEVDDDAHRG